MQEYKLDGKWTLTQLAPAARSTLNTARGARQLMPPTPALVPGDVVADLLRAKRVPDPFQGENEQHLLWIGESDWAYARSFQVPASLLREEYVLLQCDGLDTFATVQINGTTVATTDNMHRAYAWDVKPLLRAGNNTIRVVFRSVNDYTRDCFKKRALRSRVIEGLADTYPAWVRKEQCNFGWDWGVNLVTFGIWRSLRLVGYCVGRVESVRVDQAHTAGQVALTVAVEIGNTSRQALTLRATVLHRGQVVDRQEAICRGRSVQLDLTVKNPALWWPNGLGAQPLYEVQVELLDRDGELLDAQLKRVGLRTLVLDRHADQWGESFQFVVNGTPFFAKGANWIPVDAVLGRRTPELYRTLVTDAAAVNMNMLRVWGGGIYEDDCFYDLCDELGICVWQDFMFACMAYPAWDKAFLKNVEAEARDNVRRIRHHACVALWCGNNEMEQQAVNKSGKIELLTWKEYEVLFDGLLAKVVREEAPQSTYWPSSPHSPHGDRANYNNPACGDAHLWDVWHGKKPFEWYRTCGHRFNSEFGFQSFPEPRTVYGYTAKQDRNITSPVMEHHQRSGIGNTTIMQYMLDWFRLPATFEMTLWASQILQGMAIKYAVEHWRRSMPRGMGTLYWQLNDVWPVASWASIDFHGRWKALQYMARHFFAPVMVSGLEDAAKGTVEVHVTCDLPASLPGTLSWVVTDAAGRKLLAGTKAVRTPSNGNRKVTTLELAGLRQQQSDRDLLVWLELETKGQPKSTNLVTFARPKQLSLAKDAGISATVTAVADGAFQVALKTKHPALWTWLELEDADAKYSDNFLHLRPGQTATVQVQPAAAMTLVQFRNKLRVQSLVDTF